LRALSGQQGIFDAEPPRSREWCINTAVVDPATKSILANSEDGQLYRSDLTCEHLDRVRHADGGNWRGLHADDHGCRRTVYAINNAILFAVGP
jgi:hypothetical protein